MDINKIHPEELKTICGGAVAIVDINAEKGIIRSRATKTGGFEHLLNSAVLVDAQGIDNKAAQTAFPVPRNDLNRGDLRNLL